MGNGHKDLKTAADLIAPPNTESGLAAVIKELSLVPHNTLS